MRRRGSLCTCRAARGRNHKSLRRNNRPRRPGRGVTRIGDNLCPVPTQLVTRPAHGPALRPCPKPRAGAGTGAAPGSAPALAPAPAPALGGELAATGRRGHIRWPRIGRDRHVVHRHRRRPRSAPGRPFPRATATAHSRQVATGVAVMAAAPGRARASPALQLACPRGRSNKHASHKSRRRRGLRRRLQLACRRALTTLPCDPPAPRRHRANLKNEAHIGEPLPAGKDVPPVCPGHWAGSCAELCGSAPELAAGAGPVPEPVAGPAPEPVAGPDAVPEPGESLEPEPKSWGWEPGQQQPQEGA